MKNLHIAADWSSLFTPDLIEQLGWGDSPYEVNDETNTSTHEETPTN